MFALALSQPDQPPRAVGAGGPLFRWDREGLFRDLEREFLEAAGASPEEARGRARAREAEGRAVLARLAGAPGVPAPEDLLCLEEVQFRLGALAAAHRELLPLLAGFTAEARLAALDAARRSGPPGVLPLDSLYRVVAGGRAALDEALAQHGPDALPALLPLGAVPSASPSVLVHGVRVHSGDLLLSRGGAPTSALIARGSDYPGVFSHAALAHVDPTSGRAVAVEALIERGAVVSSLEAYLGDPKLRILLLRLRPDHPALTGQPELPHRAASAMLARVRGGPIPYDFPMDWEDPSALFCSEVLYHAYRPLGVELWSRRSRISAPGLAGWLAALGVRHFTTLVPSDLEYDPALAPVAEWRNPEGLARDRFDSAILDALLEAAEGGVARLGYAGWELPVARLAKGWSVLAGALGAEPPIPAGMSAGAALRVRALTRRVHPRILGGLEARAARFREHRGFEPPYWELVALAREAVAQTAPDLYPALRIAPAGP
ncbi:MAG: YiiX/YebB-like N1pC/P60 family cysteine hydrolase [Thermodesulfobacteriota bacterium]